MAVAILWPYRSDELAKAGAPTALSYTLRLWTSNGGVVEEDLTFDAEGSDLAADRNYWVSGDDQADGSSYGGVGDLVRLLEAALNTNSNGITFTVTRNSDGTLNVTTDAGTAMILWAHANTTLAAEPFGFVGSYPAISSDDFDSPNVAGGQFLPGKSFRTDHPAELAHVAIGETASGEWRGAEYADALTIRDVSFGLLARERGPVAYAELTQPANTFGHLWRRLRRGRPCRVYDDASAMTSSDYTLYRLRADSQSDPLQRDGRNRLRYEVTGLGLVEVSA